MTGQRYTIGGSELAGSFPVGETWWSRLLCAGRTVSGPPGGGGHVRLVRKANRAYRAAAVVLLLRGIRGRLRLHPLVCAAHPRASPVVARQRPRWRGAYSPHGLRRGI